MVWGKPRVSDELLRFRTDDGTEVVFEVSGDEPGFREVSRGRGAITDAGRTFEDSLTRIRAAAVRALSTFRDTALSPDGVEIEFGVRFNAEAGAVVAKTSVEGHMVVKLSWTSDRADRS